MANSEELIKAHSKSDCHDSMAVGSFEPSALESAFCESAALAVSLLGSFSLLGCSLPAVWLEEVLTSSEKAASSAAVGIAIECAQEHPLQSFGIVQVRRIQSLKQSTGRLA